jgi:hypothetical protein
LGLEVKMQQERSQGLNRFFARRRMCELLEVAAGAVSKEDLSRERARKQKARRRRRAKAKDGDQ